MADLEELVASSREVIANCVLENGAIVAANTDSIGYPKTAVDYRYVWGRDAAYTLYASKELGAGSDRTRNFARWLLERAEGFQETGTVIKRYSTNGAHDWRYGREYQPDQAGALLWAFCETTDADDKDVDEAIRLLANGLSRQWRGTHFINPLDDRLPTQDLWEDNEIKPGEERVFTYTLAAAVRGMHLAITRLGRQHEAEAEQWTEAVESMDGLFTGTSLSSYPWKLPYMPDDERQVDVSLIAAAWPFNPGGSNGNALAKATLAAIDKELYTPGLGFRRYKGDIYDGIVSKYVSAPRRKDRRKAGAWPLGSSWRAAGGHAVGDELNSQELFSQTVAEQDGLLIPEQVFPKGDDRNGRGPIPLAWSHAMFVLAARQLGWL